MSLSQYGNGPLCPDSIEPDAARERISLNAGGQRTVEGRAVGRVDIARERDARGRPDLYEIDHHGAVTARDFGGEIVEMSRAACRHAVRELRAAGMPHHVDILDLDEARRRAVALEQEIDPACFRVFHLAPQKRIICERWNLSRHDRLFHEPVRPAGIDADQLRPRAEI